MRPDAGLSSLHGFYVYFCFSRKCKASMIKRGGKVKKKRFDSIKALHRSESKRHRFLGSLDYDDVFDMDEEDEYEADDEEYEDLEEDLTAEVMDLGI